MDTNLSIDWSDARVIGWLQWSAFQALLHAALVRVGNYRIALNEQVDKIPRRYDMASRSR